MGRHVVRVRGAELGDWETNVTVRAELLSGGHERFENVGTCQVGMLTDARLAQNGRRAWSLTGSTDILSCFSPMPNLTLFSLCVPARPQTKRTDTDGVTQNNRGSRLHPRDGANSRGHKTGSLTNNNNKNITTNTPTDRRINQSIKGQSTIQSSKQPANNKSPQPT